MSQRSGTKPDADAARFIAALITGTPDAPGALAIVDHLGALILLTRLPDPGRSHLLGREGLLAHLTQWLPSLGAISAVYVSPPPSTPSTDPDGTTIPASPQASEGLPLPRLLAWLGLTIHVVAPEVWRGTYSAITGPGQPLRRLVMRTQPSLVPTLHVHDDVTVEALLMAFYALHQQGLVPITDHNLVRHLGPLPTEPLPSSGIAKPLGQQAAGTPIGVRRH